MAELIGQTIDGKYRIEELLGQGGMGMIYRAMDLNLQRPVAIKVMHEHLATHEQFRERFLQEARAAAGLDHPNIVKVINFTPQSDRLYIVMELISGGSLRDYLNSIPTTLRYLEPDEAIPLVRQIADALHYAHQAGMIHRDVKPENILLKPTNTPGAVPAFQAMLTDFGLAKLTESIGYSMTGKPLGTFPYMSPEQCKGDQVDGRTDIYALGIVLYELTVGRLPFIPQNIWEAYRMHTLEPIPPPSATRSGFPKAVEKVIEKCLAKNREDRYQNAAKLATVLERLQLDLKTDYGTSHGTQPQPPADINIKTDVEGIAPVPPPQPQVQLQDQTQPEPQPPVVAPPSPPAAPYVPPDIDDVDFGTEPEPEGAAPQLDQDTLVISGRNEPDRVVALTKPVMVIGRDPRTDIVLPGNQVSREHARIERSVDGTYWVKDLGSTNRARLEDLPLSSEKAEEWVFGQTLHIAHYTLRLQPGIAGGGSAFSQTNAEGSMALSGTMYRMSGIFQGENQPIHVAMMPANVKISPADSVDVRVEIKNKGYKTDDLMLEIRGMPGEWATISNEMFSIDPGETVDSIITFIPPRRWTSRASRHTYTLRIHSARQQMEVALVTGILHVTPYQDFVVDIHPLRIYDGGMTTVTIANHGNAVVDLGLSAQDRENGLYFHFERQRLLVEPGQKEQVTLEVSPRPQALVHGAKLMPYDLVVTAADGETRTVKGELLVIADLIGQRAAAAASAPVAASPGPRSYATQEAPPGMYGMDAAVPAPLGRAGVYEPEPYPAPIYQRPAPERGGCLTLWLGFYTASIFVLAGLVLFITFGLPNVLAGGPFIAFLLIIGCWTFVMFYAFAVFQVWRWQRWGLYLLMFVSFFLIPIGPLLTYIWWLLSHNVEDKFR